MKKVCILKRSENTQKQNEAYSQAIECFGGSPIFIDEKNWEELDDCRGIVITGGNTKGKLDDFLIEYALKHQLPLLGICQGMQSMAMYHSDIQLEEVANHHKKEGFQHEVKIIDSRFKDIVGKDTIMVNTYHHQTVRSSKEFRIVGFSDDGLIEIVENSSHPFQIGVQWHPERMIHYDENSVKLFQSFIDSL